jgi:DNA polymerase-3 subunit epsilon
MDAAENLPLDRVAAEDLPRDLVFVDLETTGANAARDRITEVGLIRVRNGELVDQWSSLVNPECPIPPYIEAFTGISNPMVAGAPRFAEIAALVHDKLRGALFVAHNARFDYAFLRSEFRKADIQFCAQVLCTVKLSRRLFPQYARHNLDAVMERHGLACDARHRALGDARVLHDFWCKLRREVPEPRLAAALRTVLGAHRLPDHLPPGLADELPEGPGVYRLFGEGDALLYVGRSHSLRARVCGHFAADGAESKDQRLAKQVRRIDWVETFGELGAMLREAQWLKSQKPLYNGRIKGRTQSYTLRAGDARTASDRAGPAAVAIDGLDPADLAQCFGVFHSEKDARKALSDIARGHQLCLKVLGLEEGPGPCTSFEAGQCRGSCVGKESPIFHEMRLRMALSSLKLKAWPFPGRVALREGRDPRGGGFDARDADLHVVDHWAYLGTARREEELAELASADARPAFDADVYRILLRYFSKHPRLHWHDLSEKTACT